MPLNFLFVHINEWADFASPDAMPISQAYILANLKRHGYDGAILGDYQDRTLTPADFREHFQRLRPAALGFSVYEENIDRVRLWARYAKSIDPGVLVVLGGPQTTFMPRNALLQMREADVLCRGEGETVFLALADALADGRALGSVPGICCRDNGAARETGPCNGPDDLDELPSPYLEHIIDPAGKSRVILLSSRGCNSSCTFCYTPRASGRRVRFHSIARIIAEMKHLRQQGINDFWFADPNFAHSRKRLENLLSAIISDVPGVSFWCQTRYNLVDEELLSLLKMAGAHTIAFGLETVHTETLARIRKGLDPGAMSRAIQRTQQAGIRVELFTLFGLPGESLANAGRTLAYVRENNVPIEGNSISQQLHLFFGTPINDDPPEHGIRPLPVTKPAYRSVCRDYSTDSMSSQDIEKMSLRWRLHRRDFSEDVDREENLFAIAGFITRHREKLADSPQADILLARIYMALDEYAAAAACLQAMRSRFPGNPEAEAFLAGPFTGYATRRRGISRPGCRIIFDCRGFIDGEPVPETECHYRINTLGTGELIPAFDKGMTGRKAGSAFQFDAVFPEDYGSTKLAGRRVVFQAFLYQVLEPVPYRDIDEMAMNPTRNMYRINDLVNLRKYNENLYYMVLRDSILHTYGGNLTDMMALFNYSLKLGFRDKAMDIAWSLPQEPSIMGHIGRVLLANGHPVDALEFLEFAAGTSAEMENQRIKAHMALCQYREAEEIAAQPALATSLETMHLKVTLASLLRLPAGEYLRRMDTLLDSQVKMMAADML
jgi:radical SAM superfamily enzyme YgiQ (UPF0313 family)/tetratricopeptide (TPR) repeat protein